MGIKNLILLCTTASSVCDFSAITPSRVYLYSDATPTAVIDGNCWIYECAYKLGDLSCISTPTCREGQLLVTDVCLPNYVCLTLTFVCIIRCVFALVFVRIIACVLILFSIFI